MRHPILLTAALLFAGIAASAQNLNPVVEVTNTYEQSAAGIDKPDQTIAVPDSLLRFNLDVDYEMRTAPYKGAYEFNPYLVELKPMPRLTGEGTLLVRLGAGYGFHPELDAVWSPVKKDNFRMNLYARHNGYFGPYRSMISGSFMDTFLREAVNDNGVHVFQADKETLYNGSDATTSAGVNTLLNWNTGSWTSDLHYTNLLASDEWTQSNHHVVSLQTRVKSAQASPAYYNLGVKGSYLARTDGVKGGQLMLDGGIGTNRRGSQARLDLFGEAIFTQRGEAGQFGFIPRYVFRIGSLHLNLGLKLAFTYRSQEDYYPNKGGFVFPDVRVDFRVVPEDFILYASATGGNVMRGYAPLLMENHFLASFGNDGYDVEVEHVNIAAGARGNIGRRLRFDSKLGFSYKTNAALWGFFDDPNRRIETEGFGTDYPVYSCWSPYLGKDNYGLFYVDFEGGWESESVSADAHLRYQASNLKNDYLFAPAAFTAQAKFMYNWAERIKAGVNLDASTARMTQPETEGALVYSLPGYADLGLYGEYGITRKFAAWLKVGNLLNQEVQRTPFHAERGIYFTIGVQYHM